MDVVHQLSTLGTIVRWGRVGSFRLSSLPKVLAGGEEEERLLWDFLDKAQPLEYGLRELTVMHPDDLRQVFDELHVGSATRIIVRRVVSFPTDAVDAAFGLLKFAAFGAVFSARIVKHAVRVVSRPPLLLAYSVAFLLLFRLFMTDQVRLALEEGVVEVRAAAHPYFPASTGSFPTNAYGSTSGSPYSVHDLYDETEPDSFARREISTE